MPLDRLRQTATRQVITSGQPEDNCNGLSQAKCVSRESPPRRSRAFRVLNCGMKSYKQTRQSAVCRFAWVRMGDSHVAQKQLPRFNPLKRSILQRLNNVPIRQIPVPSSTLRVHLSKHITRNRMRPRLLRRHERPRMIVDLQVTARTHKRPRHRPNTSTVPPVVVSLGNRSCTDDIDPVVSPFQPAAATPD